MRLYLLRHGHSPSVLDAGVAYDADRPLSPAGREGVRKAAALLLEKGARPALILHSPLRRALETAREAAALLKPPSEPEAFEALSNAVAAEELYERLRERAQDLPELLAIGHQPQLGELAAFLTGKILELRPSGLIALELGAAAKPLVLWTLNPQDGPIG